MDVAADDAVDVAPPRLRRKAYARTAPMKLTAFFTFSFAHCDSDQ